LAVLVKIVFLNVFAISVIYDVADGAEVRGVRLMTSTTKSLFLAGIIGCNLQQSIETLMYSLMCPR